MVAWDAWKHGCLTIIEWIDCTLSNDDKASLFHASQYAILSPPGNLMGWGKSSWQMIHGIPSVCITWVFLEEVKALLAFDQVFASWFLPCEEAKIAVNNTWGGGSTYAVSLSWVWFLSMNRTVCLTVLYHQDFFLSLPPSTTSRFWKNLALKFWLQNLLVSVQEVSLNQILPALISYTCTSFLIPEGMQMLESAIFLPSLGNFPDGTWHEMLENSICCMSVSKKWSDSIYIKNVLQFLLWHLKDYGILKISYQIQQCPFTGWICWRILFSPLLHFS